MASYKSFMNIMQTLNPMYQTFMSRSAFDIGNQAQRNLYQIEGYVRQQLGQITQAQAEARGVFVSHVPLNDNVKAGMLFTLDSVSNSVLPSKKLVEDDGAIAKRSIISTTVNSMVIGEGIRSFRQGFFSQDDQEDNRLSTASTVSTKSIRVDNRDAIDPDGLYMWELSSTHVIFDICDEYHGRVYKGSDVPPPLHYGCNCRVRLLQGKYTGGRENSSTSNSKIQGNGNRMDTVSAALASENSVWKNVQRVVGYSNMAMDALEKVQGKTQEQTNANPLYRKQRTQAQEFTRFMVNPYSYFLDKAAIGLVGDVKEQALKHAVGYLQKEILVRAGYSDEIASHIQKGGSTLNGYVNSTKARQQGFQQYKALTKLYDNYNGSSSMEEGIQNLRDSMDALDTLGLDTKRLRKVVNSPVLDMTSTQAMMLETGIRGTMRAALILF